MVNALNPPAAAQPARPVTPLGILTAQLQQAVVLLEQETISAEAKAHLHQALQLAAGLDPYIEACTTGESAALKAISDRTRQEAWSQRFSQGDTTRPLEQEMLSGQVEGQALKFFVRMMRAHRILDIGMFTGYSALAMAEALPETGHLIACEVDPYAAEIAQTLFQRSPHGSKIEVRLGAALTTLHTLAAAQAQFDLVFIDADKREYIAYLQTLLDTNLLAPEGIICVDNTLLQGQPYLPPTQRSANGQAIADFNQFVAADARVEQVLLPLRDGLTLIRRC